MSLTDHAGSGFAKPWTGIGIFIGQIADALNLRRSKTQEAVTPEEPTQPDRRQRADRNYLADIGMEVGF
ncbi:MAG: hypothetical protein KDE03_07000 [Rhodobacteraceae bacterium]|nr:hypothetical protein [Paracoccaceae bacterium]